MTGQHDATLFKLDTRGNVLMYRVFIDELPLMGYAIRRVYGVVNGKLQTETDSVTVGKQKRTPYEQAVLMANSYIKKKKDLGYKSFTQEPDLNKPNHVVGIKRALKKAGVATDAQGRIKPMLAQDFFDSRLDRYDATNNVVVRTIKPKYQNVLPAYAQYKFDGVRCTLHINREQATDEVTLTSRGGKPYDALIPYLDDTIKKLPTGFYDTELYIHDREFEEIVSIVKAPHKNPVGAKQLMFVCYDFVPDNLIESSFELRFMNMFIKSIQDPFTHGAYNQIHDHFAIANTAFIQDIDTLYRLHAKAVKEFYEGIIIRTKHGTYGPGTRSHDLLKFKQFSCREYKIVGGFPQRKGWVLNLAMQNGETFAVTPPGNEEQKAYYKNNFSKIAGKMMTVKYFGFTKYGKPRHPIAIGIRDYE